jgi:hypothetical protein
LNEPVIGYLSNSPTPSSTDLYERSRDETRDGATCHGLSNSSISRPFPKVVAGEEVMKESLGSWANNGENTEELVERMFVLLR